MADPVFANADNRPVFVENGTPVVLDSNMTISDSDGDPFNGANLNITFAADAVLGGSGTLSFVAGDVLIGAVVIGTYIDNPGSRSIAFNANADNARVNALLQQLTYAFPGDAPPEFDFVGFSFNNPDNDFATIRVDLVPVNEAPAIVSVAPTAGYLAVDGAPPLSAVVDIGDVDSPLIAGATVRIANGIADDFLTVEVGTSGILAIHTVETFTLRLLGARTQAQYEEVLATVTYESGAADPTNGGANPTRMIEWQIDDGAATNNLSAIATTTVSSGAGTVVPVVDHPPLPACGER